MKVIGNILDFDENIEETSVAIGVFDGVHLGHKELIKKAIEDAHKTNKKSVVFTFLNPLKISKKNNKMINTIEEKLYLIEKLGVDYLILQKFTKRFSELEPEYFIKEILKKRLNVKSIFVGFNFRFGKDGKGDAKYLKKICQEVGIKVEIIEAVKIFDEVISSTKIREALQNKDLKKANNYLGENLIIIGNVIHGKKLGRVLGFPTANLEIVDRFYPTGIYGGKVKIEGESFEREAVVNIGKNPTLKPNEKTIEIHILDFNEDIYGKKVYLQLCEYLREEKKFNTIEELKTTIANDVAVWRKKLKG